MNLKGINVEPGLALPCIDLAGTRFATTLMTLPCRVEGRLRVCVTKDGVLVVQAADRIRAAYDERHILMAAMVVAKLQLNVERHTLTGVVFLDDEFLEGE